jgi:hypothetical protein
MPPFLLNNGDQTDPGSEGCGFAPPIRLKARNLLHPCNMIQVSEIGHVTEVALKFFDVAASAELIVFGTIPPRAEFIIQTSAVQAASYVLDMFPVKFKIWPCLSSRTTAAARRAIRRHRASI